MQKRKSMMSIKHSIVESLYLCADNVFGYENWLHEILGTYECRTLEFEMDVD